MIVVYADGACRGNPGPMSIGASIQNDHGTELGTVSALIGQGTNNIAEYRAAIEGVKELERWPNNWGLVSPLSLIQAKLAKSYGNMTRTYLKIA